MLMHTVVLIHHHTEENLNCKKKECQLDAVHFVAIVDNIGDHSLENKWLDDTSEGTDEGCDQVE